MFRKLKGTLLALALVMSTVSCTLEVGVGRPPTPAPGATLDAVATLDKAVRETLMAPKPTPTTSPDVKETVQAAVAATVAAQVGTAVPEPTAILPAPAGTPALVFSTYFGNGDSDEIRDLAVDGQGNIYVVGTTSSPGLPTTPDAYDGSYNGNKDAFVAKLSADGNTLLYSTYLGGSGDDSGTAIALAGEGSVYIAGDTWSDDFPATPGAADTRRDGGQDAFAAKLSAAGELIYSTYLGGDSDDAGGCIAVDDAGNAYVGGGTYGFPVTPGAAQATHGGLIDGFVAKLSADGSSLVYGTHIGGSSYEGIYGIAIDHEGNAYVAGLTQSSNFPTSPGAYDRVCENCVSSWSGHGVAAKLSADGSEFLYSTLVGGSGPECGEAFDDVAIDPAGSAYLTGSSTCADYPTTPGALQRACGGGNDAVVTKLNPDGSDLLYSTYLGGAGTDFGLGISVDAAGDAYVAGRTDSVDFPAAFPSQPTNGGRRDTFIVVLNPDASTMLFGSYFGGSGDELEDNPGWVGFGLTARGAYVAGPTNSTDLPTTAGAYDTSFNGGGYDGFVALLNPFASEASNTPTPAPAPAAAPTPLNNTWHVAVDGSDTAGDGSEAKPFSTIQHGIDAAGDGDTVLVHPGTYKENINFRGKDITVGSLFVTTGDKNYIVQTVIDGNRQDSVVTFASGETTAALLSGLTITKGLAQGDSQLDRMGGGVFCSDSSPSLTHLKVLDNEAAEEGGGLYFDGCSPTIQDVSVVDNRAYGGGGMRFSYGRPSLQNVVVTNNTASSSGGGLQFYHADAMVTNALIAGNVANDQISGDGGGGLYFDGCNPVFVNLTVVGNSTAGHGGGLHVSFSSNPTLVNSIVWGNTPEQIYFDTDWPGEAVTIEYSDIQGGEEGIVTNGQGPVNWGEGNMDTDPRFVNAGAEDYRLADDSPCLAAGRTDGAPATDLEGNPRPNPEGSRPDLGAYESPSKGAVRLMGPVARVL